MVKLLKFLASPMLMVIFIIAFAVSCAIATFIENDFGSLAARALVYNAWWFELIMLLLASNFLASIFTRKLYRSPKLAIMIFHIGFVVILIGAAVTRYFGQEGSMHIRKGQIAKSFTSTQKWLSIYVDSKEVVAQKVNFTPVSRNKFSKTIKLDDTKFKVSLKEFVPHAVESVVEEQDGYPVVSLIILDSMGVQPALIRPDAAVEAGGMYIGFPTDDIKLDIEISLTDTGVVAKSKYTVFKSPMSVEEQVQISPNAAFKLEPQTFYHTNQVKFAYRGHLPSARIKMVYNPDPAVNGEDVLVFKIMGNGKQAEIFVPLAGNQNEPVYKSFCGVKLGFLYAAKNIDIPFCIKLNDFVLERYPGSESPSSFTSKVEVLDNEGKSIMPFSIYMNNILNLNGYRFYQSSYDPDEMGTFLSVNKDFWGTAISYFGYLMLVIGIIFSVFSSGSRFRQLLAKPGPIVVIVLMLFTFNGFAQNVPVPNAIHAKEFGKLLVQDQGGRMKPISTLSGEVLRKLNRSNRFLGQSPEQIYLGMSAFPDYWQHIPVVGIKSKELRTLVGVNGELAAFINFFDYQANGTYKLNKLVQEAFAIKPAQRTALQKEIIKVDERVNVLYMIFSGQMARIFPVPNHPENKWQSMAEATGSNDTVTFKPITGQYANYLVSVRRAVKEGDWKVPKSIMDEVSSFQVAHGSHIIPNKNMINAEVVSNRILAFERLIPIYGITGILLLILVFTQLFRKVKFGDKAYILLSAILIAGFLLHTFAIGLRWYIAGRAPLSNGFESMVYVAWAAMLAGFIFARRSRVVLPATALVSTLTLFVAHLSWMDPEITNLVPVLKSYWLTIHVAVITSSYGFFGLGAILALFNMALFSFKTTSNKQVVDYQINILTTINELTLTLGLYLLTIGSFLGAIWANESWGRYWGWDPKETWALITILVYAFILHIRLIPSLKSTYGFNFGALIGIGSVLMTYFGVNYYLSGLHSYAGGSPVPIPVWLYLIVGGLFLFSFFAWYNDNKVGRRKLEDGS
jgi:cytochrome c-type biogenesis protein CcsB